VRSHSFGLRIARSFAALAALALVGSACIGGGGTTSESAKPHKSVKPIVPKEPTSPVTITFASWVGQSPQFKKFADEFHKQHPNITIEFQNVPAERATDKLTTQIAGGTPPDTAYIDASAVQTFASRGALLNLDGFVAGSKVVDADDYVGGFKASALFKGSLFGLPFDGETTGLFYRTDMFQAAGIDKPPATWEEFRADAQKLTNPSKKQYGFILFAPEAEYYWEPFLWQAGGRLMSPDGQQIAFDDSKGKTAADFYVGLRKFAPPDYLNSNSWDGRVAFATGKVAMYEAGAWFGGEMLASFPKIKGDWDVAPMPEGPAGCGTTIAGDSLVVLDQDKNADAAWLWIEFLSTKENMKAWTFGSKTTTLLPPRQSLLDDPDLGKFNPWLTGFAEQMKCAVAENLSPKWSQIQVQLNTELGKAIFGDETPTQALETAGQKGDKILKGPAE
jgi:multiple sugar transport system substrate-binding protein